MTTEASKSQLSDYQKAVLTHMGISPWQSRNVDISEKSVNQKINTSADTEVKSTQAQRHASLEKLKQQVAKSDMEDMHNQIVLCFDPVGLDKKMLNDVLLSLGSDLEKAKVTNKKPEQICHFHFAWRLGDALGIDKNVLTTPVFAGPMSKDLKRKLWALISPLDHAPKDA